MVGQRFQHLVDVVEVHIHAEMSTALAGAAFVGAERDVTVRHPSASEPQGVGEG